MVVLPLTLGLGAKVTRFSKKITFILFLFSTLVSSKNKNNIVDCVNVDRVIVDCVNDFFIDLNALAPAD